MILSLLITLSLTFMFMNHPLSMGMILLGQTILTSLIIGLMNYNFWYSYILLLIMVGGMLILFIYMTSIASNEKFKNSIYLVLFNSILLMIILTIILFMDKSLNLFFFMKNDMISNKLYINSNLSMNKTFNYPNNMMLLMIIIYLLVSLIAMVKISSTMKGPLRQMN